MEPVVRFHSPEPAAGSIRAADGRQADLFNVGHYPVRAICRVCGNPIQAGSFLYPFQHTEPRHTQR